MTINLIIFGSPGSGKGTQSNFLRLYYKIPHISIGNILRLAIKQSTKLGNLVKTFINKGILVPDYLINKLVKNRLNQKDCSNGFILDGFPRTKKQAISLEKNLYSINSSLSAVLNILVNDKTVLKRLMMRQICPLCGSIYIKKPNIQKQNCANDNTLLIQRNDDTPKTINIRLKTFKKETLPLIKFYTNKNLIFNIDGSQSYIKVYNEIIRKLTFNKI